MYVAPLSPVLEESLKRPEQPSISILQTADAASLKYIFVEKVIDALLRHDRIMVVVDDDEDLAMPVKLLSNHRLGHLCLVWNNSDRLGDAQLERFQILKDLKPLERKTGSFDHLVLQKKSIEARMCKILQEINNPLLGDLSLKEIIQKRIHNEDHLHAWSPVVHTNPEKINEILDALQIMQGSWKDRYGVWQSLNIFHDAVFSDRETTDKVRSAIFELLDEAGILSNDLESLLASAQQRIRDRIWAECDIWRNAADELMEMYYSQEIDQRFAHWEAETERILALFQGTSYLRFETLGIGYFDWDQTMQNVEKINNYLASQNHLIDEYTSEYFKRLTPFNSEDPELLLVVDRVKKFATKISDVDHHNLHLESDVLLIQVLRQYLRSINVDLENARHLINDEEYLLFKKVQVDSGLSNEAIRYLAGLSNDGWDHNYIQCVFNVMARQAFTPEMRMIEKQISQYARLGASVADALGPEIHNGWCKQKDEGLHHIQYHNADLYNILFEAKQTTLSVSNIYFNDPLFLQSFYPIVCVRKKHIGEILSNTHATWEQMFFLNTKEVPFMDFPVGKMEICIATSHELAVEDLMKEYPVRYFYAAERRPDYTRPFTLLSRSEKYHQALQLATCILSVVERFVVFQVGDESCISLLNQDLHQALIKQLPSDQLNLLYEGSTDIEPLIEALIHPDSRVHLFVENHLINDAMPESLEWQMAVLKWLKQAGVSIHSVDTHEIYRSADGGFTGPLRELIKTNQRVENSEFETSSPTT